MNGEIHAVYFKQHFGHTELQAVGTVPVTPATKLSIAGKKLIHDQLLLNLATHMMLIFMKITLFRFSRPGKENR